MEQDLNSLLEKLPVQKKMNWESRLLGVLAVGWTLCYAVQVSHVPLSVLLTLSVANRLEIATPPIVILAGTLVSRRVMRLSHIAEKHTFSKS